MLRQLGKKSTSRQQQSCHKLLLRRLQSSMMSNSSSSSTTGESTTIVSTAMPRRTLSSFQLQNQNQVEGYAMKALMDTLQVALVSPHRSPISTPLLANPPPQLLLPPPDYMNLNHADTSAIGGEFEQQDLAALSQNTRAHPWASNQSKKASSNHTTFSSDGNVFTDNAMEKIQTAMNKNRVRVVWRKIDEATASSSGIRLHRKFLFNCFRYMTTRNPLYAHDILNRYNDIYTADAQMYERLCKSIETLTSSHGPSQRTKQVISSILVECQERLTQEQQLVVLPILLESALHTKLRSARAPAKLIYAAITNYNVLVKPAEDDAAEEDAAEGDRVLVKMPPLVDLTADNLERLVGYSRYWADENLPYHDVLQRYAATGAVPQHPTTFIYALSHMFPFIPATEMLVAVEAIHDIVKTSQEQENQNGDINPIQIDMGMLEQIMASAARERSHELGLATLDLCETLGYTPTESCYESMIQAFVMSYRQDQCVFACLADMEDVGGLVPSRSLLRSISRSLRFSVNRIDNAYRYIMTRHAGARPTLSSLNAIMSACAELGDVERTFSVLFDDFPKPHIKAEPNIDSFCFAMESLAVSANKDQQEYETEQREVATGNEYGDTTKTDNAAVDTFDERRRSRLEAAETILNVMEELNLAINNHVFHEYIRVLMNSEELEMATVAAIDALDTKSIAVENKTLMLLVNRIGAAAETSSESFGVARNLVRRMTENFDFLYKRLDAWEHKAINRTKQIAASAVIKKKKSLMQSSPPNKSAQASPTLDSPSLVNDDVNDGDDMAADVEQTTVMRPSASAWRETKSIDGDAGIVDTFTKS